MSRGASRDLKRQSGARAECFDRQLQNFWVERICKIPQGKTIEVWLTPRWTLTTRYLPMSKRVGTEAGYTRACELSWFREDCFEALEGR